MFKKYDKLVLFYILCTIGAIVVFAVYYNYINNWNNFAFGEVVNLNSTRSNVVEKIDFIPSIVHHLKHINDSNLLKPKIKISQNRNAKIVIGVPTMKRSKISYLQDTIYWLVNTMNDAEKDDTLIVVQIAQSIDDPHYVNNRIETLKEAFQEEINTGLIDIVVPPETFYPNIAKLIQDDILTNKFKANNERLTWRTRQIYDFVYLMCYSFSRAKYYLQLEDDVLAANGYIGIMQSAIKQRDTESNKWIMIEFSRLGFIGKLFKSEELPLLIHFFILFRNEKPIDWLLDEIFKIKYCYEKNYDCKLKSVHPISLFQHYGFQSSLDGKQQPLKDPGFPKTNQRPKRDNPNATIITPFETYTNYNIQQVYLGSNYSRLKTVNNKTGNEILFHFQNNINLKKFLIKSGNFDYPNETFSNVEVEVLFVPNSNKPNSTTTTFQQIVNRKLKTGIIVEEISGQQTNIQKLRVKFTTSTDFVTIDDIIFIHNNN